MYFNIKKRLFIHKGFMLFPIPLFISEQKYFYLTMLMFAFLHELAHYLAALRFGEKPDRLFVTPYGFELRLHSAMMQSEIYILLAGPAFSLFLAAAGYFFKHDIIYKTNMTLFLINIIPAFPLDGGKLLKLFLWRQRGVYHGNRYLKRVGYAVAFFAAAAAVILPNPWFAAISVLIITRQAKLSGTPFYKKRKKIVPVKIFYVSKDLPLMELCRLFSPYYYIGVVLPGQDAAIYEDGIVEALRRTEYKGVAADINV